MLERHAITDLDDESDVDSGETRPRKSSFEITFFEGSPFIAATHAPISEMAQYLEELLSRRLTAFAVGVRDVKTIGRWASDDVDSLRSSDVERRLRTLYHVALLLRTVDAPSTVKAWFMGANPELDDVSPLEMIRQDADREVLGAARSFVANA
jgi:hypothetical protein